MTTDDDLDQIERLFRLRESGALTHAEFEAEKSRVLSRGEIEQPDGAGRVADQNDPVEPISRSGNVINNRLPLGLSLVLVAVLGVPLVIWRSQSQLSADQPPSMNTSKATSTSSQTTGAPNATTPPVTSNANGAPHVGMVLDNMVGEDSRDYGGWKRIGGFECGNKIEKCVMEVFKKRNKLIITRDATEISGPFKKKYHIEYLTEVYAEKSGEIPAFCYVHGKLTSFSFVNTNSSIRSYMPNDTKISEVISPFKGWDENLTAQSDAVLNEGKCERGDGHD